MTNLSDLVHRWVDGFCLADGLAAPTRAGDTSQARLTRETHTREVFLAGSDPAAVRFWADRVMAMPERTWYTVITEEPDEAEQVMIEAGLDRSYAREWFMTVDLDRQLPGRTAAGYTSVLIRTGDVLRMQITAADEKPAAFGVIGLRGSVAVPHAIGTEPGHRRRGLGAQVMDGLVSAAREAGAATGLLIGTDMGRALYESLGWRTAGTVIVGKNTAATRA
ncbi:N-acetyltransferase [Pseudonocardiaceae bacterium YIM PH 21723]|nr:N-acetyltransferase [Pseudonocardiaceae bacterium YIM PH 21723]